MYKTTCWEEKDTCLEGWQESQGAMLEIVCWADHPDGPGLERFAFHYPARPRPEADGGKDGAS